MTSHSADLDDLEHEASNAETFPERLCSIAVSTTHEPTLRAVALNPNTPAATFWELEKHFPREAALHPNTPTVLLWELAMRFPHEVLGNPSLLLRHVQDPDVGNTIPAHIAIVLLGIEYVPRWMLSAFQQGRYLHYPYIKEAVERHWLVAGEVGTDWQHEMRGEFNTLAETEAARFGKWLPETPAKNISQTRINTWQLVPQWLMAPLVETFKRQIQQLGNSLSPKVQRNLAFLETHNPLPNRGSAFFLPDQKLDDHGEILARYAERVLQVWNQAKLSQPRPHQTSPQEELLRERLRAARDPDTPPGILKELASDAARQVRMFVARHPNAPGDTLELLVADSDSYVRCALARNVRLPQTLIARLAHDPHCVVRANIARHPLVATRILDDLSRDADGEVLDALFHRHDLSSDIAERVAQCRSEVLIWGRERSLNQKMRDPQTPLSALLALLETDPGNVELHRCIVHHRQVPLEVLKRYAIEGDLLMRSATAESHSLPAALLFALGSETSLSVRTSVAGNKRTPPDCLFKLAAEATPFEIALRLALATNESSPVAALEILVAHLEELMRDAVQDISPHEDAYYARQRYYSHFGGYAGNHHKYLTLTALLQHPNLSQELHQRVEVLRRQDTLLEFVICNQIFERVSALSDAQLPPALLKANLNMIRWIERVAIASNPVAPRDILETLTRDGNRYVRATARERLLAL